MSYLSFWIGFSWYNTTVEILARWETVGIVPPTIKGQDLPKCGYFSVEGIIHRSPIQAFALCCLMAAGFFGNFCNFWVLQLKNTNLYVSSWVTNALPGSVKGLTLGIQDCSLGCLGTAVQILDQDTIKNKTEGRKHINKFPLPPIQLLTCFYILHIWGNHLLPVAFLTCAGVG